MRGYRSRVCLTLDAAVTTGRGAPGRARLVIAPTVMAYRGEQECGA
jgi:hypothetical protein